MENIAKYKLHLGGELKNIFDFSEKFFYSLGFEEELNTFYISRDERIDDNHSYIQIEIPYFIDYFRILDFVNLLAHTGIVIEDYVEPSLTNPASFMVKTIMKSSFKILQNSALPLFFPCASEAPFFRKLGIPTLLYGPGEIILPHTKNEFVKVSSILKCTKIYMAAISSISDFAFIRNSTKNRSCDKIG